MALDRRGTATLRARKALPRRKRIMPETLWSFRRSFFSFWC